MNIENLRCVYTVVERGTGRSFRMKLGIGFVNKDGSLTLRLDAFPLGRTLHVRPFEARDVARDANDAADANDALRLQNEASKARRPAQGVLLG
jgi:hypothetical protein